MRRFDFVFFDAGGGHRGAATALLAAVHSQGRPWDIRLFNLQEALDSLDLARQVTGVRMQDFYNWMLKSGMTLGSSQTLRVLQAAIRIYHRPCVRLLGKIWRERQPDMVVSFVPHFNRALNESFQRAFPGRPFVTILTDLANYPPHFWMEREPQYFICGTDEAVQQARELGHAADKMFRVSGMILNPQFYELNGFDRRAVRESLALLPDAPVGLVLFGGHGSRVMSAILDRLDSSGLKLQLIMICGRNEKLAADLRRRRTRIPVHIEGFTSRIPFFMRASDFFIGKPGPGSISEALATGLPVIVSCNSWTLPQERFNAQWIREKQVGLVVRSFREIAPAVAEMLRPENLERFRGNAKNMPNRAVFEIAGILEEIFQRSAPTGDSDKSRKEQLGRERVVAELD